MISTELNGPTLPARRTRLTLLKTLQCNAFTTEGAYTHLLILWQYASGLPNERKNERTAKEAETIESKKKPSFSFSLYVTVCMC